MQVQQGAIAKKTECLVFPGKTIDFFYRIAKKSCLFRNSFVSVVFGVSRIIPVPRQWFGLFRK